jgi:hypothetical protein
LRQTESKLHYENGADFWRDTTIKHGIDDAIGICTKHLSLQIKSESIEQNRFCKELFTAIYEATADRVNPEKLVYPYPLSAAADRGESAYYFASHDKDMACATAIDSAINRSCYKTYYYNLKGAVHLVAAEYGFGRVNMILANTIHSHTSDGRYSDGNREWAKGIVIPGDSSYRVVLGAHPILIEGFVTHFRNLYDELDASAHVLPGRIESGERIAGYEITRTITFVDNRGFAIGHNPNAANPYVCWQFTSENGKRDYYWGNYYDTEKDAGDFYVARVIVHMSGSDVKEIDPQRKPSVRETLAEAWSISAPADLPSSKQRKADIEL